MAMGCHRRSQDMTFDGTDLWRTDYGLDRVEKIDPATNAILSFFTPAGITGPVGIAWDGSDLWLVISTDRG
jgi:hypothetical protein